MAVVGAESTGGASARHEPTFASRHPWDRNFVLLYIGLIWACVLLGFVPDVIRRAALHRSDYPLAVHLHAAAMVGWLALLTMQVLLIRSGRTDIHRKLGLAGVVVAVAVVGLSPVAAIVTDRAHLAAHNADVGFLGVQLLDIVGFAGAVGAAFAFRSKAAAHKRLILLATLCLVDAAFVRIWGRRAVYAELGGGFAAFMISVYAGNLVLIGGIGVYDLITRRRLHPAYVAGAAWVVGLQSLAGLLYLTPAWTPVALDIIGR